VLFTKDNATLHKVIAKGYKNISLFDDPHWKLAYSLSTKNKHLKYGKTEDNQAQEVDMLFLFILEYI
jgi:hypothetical protein